VTDEVVSLWVESVVSRYQPSCGTKLTAGPTCCTDPAVTGCKSGAISLSAMVHTPT
jgi:hypothetical protein